MALIKCRDCGADVSTGARACLKCGCRVPKNRFLLIVFATMAICGGGIFAVANMSDDQHDFAHAVIPAPVPQRPPVPVTVRYRKAVMGHGFVFRLDNQLGQVIAVHFKVMRAGGSNGREYDLVLDPQRFREIGFEQNWEGAPGDHYTVEANGYASSEGVIP
jgi:hypothetical protein